MRGSYERPYRVQEEMKHRHERCVEQDSRDPCQRSIYFAANAQTIAHGTTEFRAERSCTLLVVQLVADCLADLLQRFHYT